MWPVKRQLLKSSNFWLVFCFFSDWLAKELFLVFWPEKIYKNSGLLFSVPIENWLTIAITSALFFIFLFFYIRFVRLQPSRKFCMPFALLLAGGIGNLYDRIFRGFVVDFFRAPNLISRFEGFFNLADVFIVAGIIWIGIIFLSTGYPHSSDCAK